MLSWGVFFELEESSSVFELRAHTEITIAYIPFTWRKKEDVRSSRMVLHVSDHLGDLFDFRRLEINQIVGLVIVLEIPKMDPKIVRREEILSIWADTQWVYVIVVAITKLHFLDTLIIISLLWRFRKD